MVNKVLLLDRSVMTIYRIASN